MMACQKKKTQPIKYADLPAAPELDDASGQNQLDQFEVSSSQICRRDIEIALDDDEDKSDVNQDNDIIA